LGEYLTASAARRRRIVEDQKYPPAFQVARYTEAEKAIVEFLTTGRDAARLERRRAALVAATPRSPHEAEKRRACVEAITAFEAILGSLDFDLDQVEILKAEPSASLSFSGVDVSIRPEIVLRRRNKRGTTRGCMKLYFSKTHPLDESAGGYVSALLGTFARQENPDEVDRGLLVVVDVFGGRIFQAPRATKRRLDDVSVACEEIANWWGVV
jgi:hypothetical protein